MTLDPELWPLIRCVVCARPADHALELVLPIPRGSLTPTIVGFCTKHYEQAKKTPQWKDFPIVDAAAFEPRGVG